MRNRMRQTNRLLLAIASGGMLLQITSCNPNVRDAIVTGLETTSLSIANTLLHALFAGLGDQTGTTTPTTTGGV